MGTLDWTGLFLAPQSGALRINAYRDFLPSHPNPTYSFQAFKPLHSVLKQPKQTKADQCRSRQTKADQSRPRQTKASFQVSIKVINVINVIKGNQGKSREIKGNQGKSREIKGNQGKSRKIKG